MSKNEHSGDYAKCPYCGYENPDSWEYTEYCVGEGSWVEVECLDCSKTFECSYEINITYHTKPHQSK